LLRRSTAVLTGSWLELELPGLFPSLLFSWRVALSGPDICDVDGSTGELLPVPEETGVLGRVLSPCVLLVGSNLREGLGCLEVPLPCLLDLSGLRFLGEGWPLVPYGRAVLGFLDPCWGGECTSLASGGSLLALPVRLAVMGKNNNFNKC